MAAKPPLHVCIANASLTKLCIYAVFIRKVVQICQTINLRSNLWIFSVLIINLVKALKEQRESIISNRIGRSGTSIGANIREAKYAHGTADFISKMQIALKEANETGYWL